MNPNESTTEATPRANDCTYCADPKVAHRFLSDDAGSTIEAEYRDATGSTSHAFTLGHAWDDAWWPCPAADNEVRVIVLTPESYDALQQRNRVLVAACEAAYKAIGYLPAEAFGRDTQDGYFYRDELLRNLSKALKGG